MDPILIDFPERIEGDRIYIRPCLPGDGEAVYESVTASINELKQWMPWAQGEQSVENSEYFIRVAYADFILRKSFRLHFFRKEDDRFLGSGGYPRVNWNARCFEIGYWIDSRFAGQGYATEAAALKTEFAFEHLNANRVEIRCDTENIASRRVAEKLGFTLEGTLHKDDYAADGSHLRNTFLFAKTI